MASGSDWLTNLFLYTFIFGLLFTVISLLLGGVHIGGGGHIHIGSGHVHIGGIGHGHVGHVGHVAHVGPAGGSGHGHVHVGGSNESVGHSADVHIGGHHASDADGGLDTLGILNMPTIMAFITWFGGAGYIFSRSVPVGNFVLLLMALASGLLGAAIMYLILSRLFWPMMSKPLSRADFSLPGTPARVVSPIREGGTGEIVYTKGGTRFTSGARRAGEGSVDKGIEVVILSYERGIAYVEPVQEILDRDVQLADSV